MTDQNTPTTPGAPEGAPVPPATPVTPPPTYHQAPPQQGYMPPQQNYAPPQQAQYKTRSHGFGSARKEKWPAVILAFALGLFGVHKFYMGYKTEGLVMLLISCIGWIIFGLGPAVMTVFAFIEAARYISLTQEDFEATYLNSYRGWF